MTLPRKTYTSIVVEREVAAPRQAVWDALIGFYEPFLGGPDVHLVGAAFDFEVDGLNLREEVLSLEPPWRRVYGVTGGPVALYQGTSAITDRGDSCLLVWSLVVDPLPDVASDAFLAAAESVVSDVVDRLASTAETR